MVRRAGNTLVLMVRRDMYVGVAGSYLRLIDF